MSYATLFAIYAIAWWLSLFAVLPLGVKSQEESGEVTPACSSELYTMAVAVAGSTLKVGSRLTCSS